MFFFELFVINKYFLNNCSCDYNNFSFGNLVSHEIINISLDLIKNYPSKVTNSIEYFGSFSTE
jgi:hypothetical protein